MKSLFGAQRFVQLQEQVEVGGLGVPIGTKMVVLHPQNSGTCHDKCARVEGKIEKGGATYLPSRKPFSHTLDDVLGVRGDDPRGVFVRIPRLGFPTVALLLAFALAIRITVVDSIDHDHVLQPLERSQQFRPLAGPPCPGVDIIIHRQRTLPHILFSAGESDTSSRALIPLLTAGAIGEDDAVVVAESAVGPTAIVAKPFVARAAIEEKLTADLAGSDQVVGVFLLEEGAENPFAVDDAFGVLI